MTSMGSSDRPGGDRLTKVAAMNQSTSNLNRIFPLRLDFQERSIACLNWSRGYTCSTAANNEPSATRPSVFGKAPEAQCPVRCASSCRARIRVG
jgi:hypothetical protein